MRSNSQSATLPPRDCHATNLGRTQPSNSHHGRVNATFRLLPNSLMDGSDSIHETTKQQSRSRSLANFTIPVASTHSSMPPETQHFHCTKSVRGILLHPTGNWTQPKPLPARTPLAIRNSSVTAQAGRGIPNLPHLLSQQKGNLHRLLVIQSRVDRTSVVATQVRFGQIPRPPGTLRDILPRQFEMNTG